MGDGTGVGKGREIAGIIMDDLNRRPGRGGAIGADLDQARILLDGAGVAFAQEFIMRHGLDQFVDDAGAGLDEFDMRANAGIHEDLVRIARPELGDG